MKEDIRRPEKSEAAILAEELQQSVRQAGLAAAEEPREPGKEGSGSAEGTGREKNAEAAAGLRLKRARRPLSKEAGRGAGRRAPEERALPGKNFPGSRLCASFWRWQRRAVFICIRP